MKNNRPDKSLTKDEFFALLERENNRLTDDEARALMSPLTDAQIAQCREQAQCDHGLTLEQVIEAHHATYGGLLDKINARFGTRLNHLPAKTMAHFCQLFNGAPDPTTAAFQFMFELVRLESADHRTA